MLRQFAIILFCVVFGASVAQADVESYLKTQAQAGGVSCDPAKVWLVEIEFPPDKVFFNVKPGESAEMSMKFANALGRCKKLDVVVVPRKNVAEIKKCDMRVLVATINSYVVKQGGIRRQNRGEISMTLAQFKNATADTPEQHQTVQVTGESAWGSNRPLENALTEAAEDFCGKK